MSLNGNSIRETKELLCEQLTNAAIEAIEKSGIRVKDRGSLWQKIFDELSTGIEIN